MVGPRALIRGLKQNPSLLYLTQLQKQLKVNTNNKYNYQYLEI
jgi:hypothetical protein